MFILSDCFNNSIQKLPLKIISQMCIQAAESKSEGLFEFFLANYYNLCQNSM